MIKKATISAITLFIKITVTLSASVFVRFSTINSLISLSNPGIRFTISLRSAVCKTYSHIILALEYLLWLVDSSSASSNVSAIISGRNPVYFTSISTCSVLPSASVPTSSNRPYGYKAPLMSVSKVILTSPAG